MAHSMITWVKWIGIGFAILVAATILWGIFVEPHRISVEREDAIIPGLPGDWEGKQVALVADFQVGMWGANTGTVRRIVRRLVEQPPAAVLIAGDFLYKADENLPRHISEAVGLVAPLITAGIPTFAVLGNHDYSMDVRKDPANVAMAESLRDALERAGIRVLENASVGLAPHGGRSGERAPAPNAASGDGKLLHIVGIGAHWAGRDDVGAALSQVPPNAPRLVLMHNPASFERLPPGTAPVAVAAHTHGGQVRVPFTPEWSWLTFMRDDAVHTDGWIPGDFGAPGNRLYINRGIGFSDFPVRINCPPELTLLTLRRSE